MYKSIKFTDRLNQMEESLRICYFYLSSDICELSQDSLERNFDWFLILVSVLCDFSQIYASNWDRSTGLDVKRSDVRVYKNTCLYSKAEHEILCD